MPTTYDCTRPWRDQLDEAAIESMIRTYAPEALDRLGLERLLTVKRMIDEYVAGDLSRDDLLALVAHYDGLTVKRTPLGEDPEPAPAEGCADWDLYSAVMDDRIEGTLYDDLAEAATSGRYTVPEQGESPVRTTKIGAWRKKIVKPRERRTINVNQAQPITRYYNA